MQTPDHGTPLNKDGVRRRPAWSNAVGGGVLLAVALIFVIGGIRIGLGSPIRLGAGAFPAITGLLLGALAIGVIFEALTEPFTSERPDWVSFVGISASLAVFSVVAPRFGLIPAVFLATITASLPDRSLPMPGKIVLALVMSAIGWGLFIELLDLPFKSFRGF